eukprot:2616430-Amphidinium_carterae.1
MHFANNQPACRYQHNLQKQSRVVFEMCTNKVLRASGILHGTCPVNFAKAVLTWSDVQGCAHVPLHARPLHAYNCQRPIPNDPCMKCLRMWAQSAPTTTNQNGNDIV